MIRKPSRSQGCHSRKRNCRPLRVEPLSRRELLAADLAAHPADVSGDSQLTPLDAVLVINAVQREESAAAMPAADLNTDGVIDGLDIEDVVSALIESDAAVTLASLPATTGGDLESAAGRSTDLATTDFATAWQPLASAFPTATTPALSTIATPGSIPLPGVTGPTPGTSWGQSQITGAVRVATQYPEPMPLIYTNEDLVNDPNEDGFSLYQGRVPFVVEVTYPDYDFAVDLNLEIYVSLDGVERHYRSERVESYGGRHLTQFTIPTGAAESVKVRAELINNNLGLVGLGRAIIAIGEKVEAIEKETIGFLKMLSWKIKSASDRFIREEAPTLITEAMLKQFIDEEAMLAQIVAEGNHSQATANELYRERFENASTALALPLQPFFDAASQRLFAQESSNFVLQYGENDPRQQEIRNINGSIKSAMERGTDSDRWSISDFVKIEVAKFDEIFKDDLKNDLEDFMLTGEPFLLSQSYLTDDWDNIPFIERAELMLPLRNADNVIFGHFFLGASNISISDKESTSVGGRVLNLPVGPPRARLLEAEAGVEFKEGKNNTLKANFYLKY